MKSPFRAFALEMVPALLLIVLALKMFRPESLHPSLLVSVIFAVLLLGAQTVAIRALRHFLPGHFVSPASPLRQ